MTRGPLARQIDFCSCIRCGNISPAAFVFDDGSFYCEICWRYVSSDSEFQFLNPGRGDFNVVQKDCSQVRESGEVQEDVS